MQGVRQLMLQSTPARAEYIPLTTLHLNNRMTVKTAMQKTHWKYKTGRQLMPQSTSAGVKHTLFTTLHIFKKTGHISMDN